MVNKLLFYFILFSCISNLYSQKIILIDANNNKIIPFATICLFKDNNLVQYGYFNEEGNFYPKKDILFDLVKVSCIGYENLEVYSNKITNDTLLLKPTVYHLKEVVVHSNKKLELSTLGYIKEKRKTIFGAIKGMKICTLISNPFHESKLIKSFLFKIYNRNDSKLGFKLHLYENDTITKTPGKELLTQDIIIILEGKNKKDIEHDVSNYNIELPSIGAFVGIEWFGVLSEETGNYKGVDTQNGSIELNDGSKEFNTFIKDVFSFYPWENMKKLKVDFEKYTPFKNCPTPSFGIKVYKE